MDPVSIVGIAAAGVQFAEVGAKALLGSLRLLRELREIPQRMVHLLSQTDRSVERLVHLDNVTQQTSFVNRLSQEQLDSIRSAIFEAQDVTEGLQIMLKPIVVDLARPSRTKRAWGALVSKTLEKDIEGRLETIGRIHLGLMPQLQGLGLEIAFEQMTISESINTGVLTMRAEALHGLEAVRSQVSGLEIQTSQHFSRISHQLGTFNGVPSQLRQITASTDQIGILEQQIGALRESHSELRRALQERSEVTQTDLTLLRDSVLSAITARDRRLLPAPDPTLTARLNDADTQELTRSIVTGLLSAPSTLRDTCEVTETTSHTNFRREKSRPTTTACECKKKRQTTAFISERFAAQYDYIQGHYESCPLSRAGGRFSRYSLKASLYPLIRKTIEMSFTSTRQGGGFAVSPSLKITRIVERSQSPMFQLFDDLRGKRHRIGIPEQLELVDSHPDALGWRSEQKYITYLSPLSGHEDWEVGLVHSQFRRLHKALLRMIEEGRGNLDDTDESGNTIVHEILFLLLRLRQCDRQTFKKIRPLFELAALAGIDWSAEADWDSRSIPFGLGLAFTRTTAENLFCQLTLFTREYSFDDDLIRENLPSADLLSASQGSSSSILYMNLCQSPQLTKYLGLPAIFAACVYQSMSDLTTLLVRKDPGICPGGHYSLAGVDLCPLRLAICAGWREGLEQLLEHGGDPAHALLGIAGNYDPEILRMALRDDLPKAIPLPFHRPGFGNDGVSGLVHKKPFLEAVKKRRESLRSLWVREVPDGTFSPIGSDRILDADACFVFNDLRRRNVKVHPALDPGTTSIWHCLPWLRYAELSTMGMWFNEGFLDIDRPGSEGTTPLEEVMNDWWKGLSNPKAIKTALWFLRQGAFPEFSPQGTDCCPNMVFYFAENEVFLNGSRDPKTNYHRFRSIIVTEEKAEKLTNIKLIAPCDPLTRDGCECYCSEGGCLPIVECLSNPTRKHGNWGGTSVHTQWGHHLHDVQVGIYDELRSWAETMSFTDSQRQHYVEAWVRRELFQLLGMTHTCGVWTKNRVWATPPDGLLQEIQRLEGPQLVLLEVLMEAFRAWCEQYPGELPIEELPIGWWRLVNSVFFQAAQPNWAQGLRERLDVTWESWVDVLMEMEEEENPPSGRLRPHTRVAPPQPRDVASELVLSLPGAWPDDGCMAASREPKTPPTADGKPRFRSFGERIAGRLPVWWCRRHAVRGEYFIQEMCKVLGELLSEDVIDSATEAFLEELAQET